MPINARTLFGFLGSFPQNLKQLNTSDAVLKAVVGVDAGHSRSRRRSATDVGLPLAGTHQPAGVKRFYGNSRKIRNFSLGRQSRRPLQRLLLSPVGADDSVRPQTAPVFTGIYGESVAAQRADVGIGPLHDSGKFVLPRKFRMQGVFTAIIQRQLLSNLVYRNRRRVPNRP